MRQNNFQPQQSTQTSWQPQPSPTGNNADEPIEFGPEEDGFTPPTLLDIRMALCQPTMAMTNFKNRFNAIVASNPVTPYSNSPESPDESALETLKRAPSIFNDFRKGKEESLEYSLKIGKVAENSTKGLNDIESAANLIINHLEVNSAEDPNLIYKTSLTVFNYLTIMHRFTLDTIAYAAKERETFNEGKTITADLFEENFITQLTIFSKELED